MSRAFLLAGLLGAGVLAGAAASGWDYFSLPPPERPLHPHHAMLRSSGSAGLAMGLGAAGLFALNLSYLVRKRLARLPLGSLRSWMAFHVFSGLLGAGLVVLHAAFSPRSGPGKAALAAIAVVAGTGLVGRYLYALVPRARDGRELEAAELAGESRAQLERHARVRALLGWWRFFHRWLAILMLFVVLVHVALAVRYAGVLR